MPVSMVPDSVVGAATSNWQEDAGTEFKGEGGQII